MAVKSDLQCWVREALEAMGGRARLVDVARYIWQTHETELSASGDLFFTWQYDMRWAATELRKQDVLKPAAVSGDRVWELSACPS